SVASVVVPPELYQINPSTGLASVIGPTDLGIGGVTDINGANYAFNDLTNQIEILDLLTGKATPVGSFDPAAGVVQGAAPVVPEPASLALAATGAVLIVAARRRKGRVQRYGAASAEA
ncbi:MAG TPA: PEP-CTERM sorting domain-containing protein, partial [Terriglobales bacterium]